ncbi:MAG: ECF transporter S component [Ardenticatenaceae bacterium]|nr:ECF transporter S component [Ardenticatenaceae bacterium]
MPVQRITLTAVCIAIVAVLVSSVPVPIAATGGFTHPGAIAEIFIALAFGPVVGGIAAAVGAAIADLALGYGSFAPLTFLAHGCLGVLSGYIGWKKGITGMVIGWIVGGLALVAVYFMGEATVYGFGVAGAAAELPINLFQVGLGFFGLLLYQLVKRAYPQIDQLGGSPTYQER